MMAATLVTREARAMLEDNTGRSDFDPSEPKGSKVRARTIVLIVVLVAFAIFLLQNTGEVRIAFTFIEVRAPLWLAILVAGLLGLVAGWLMGRFELGRGRMNKQR
jgi:uncharacterized integral membrane protein